MKIAVIFPKLLRETTFRRFWTGQTISLLGDQITSLALPLTAVLALHANARTMSFLTAAVWIPSVLFGIQSGAWVDRRKSRRRIMIVSDIARALLLLSIPVAYFVGWLSTWFLLAVALSTGLFALLFNISSNTLFVSLLTEEQYVTASSLLNGSRALSFLVGPSIAGWLVQIISAPFTLIIDAISFAISAVSLSVIHPTEPPAAEVQRGHTFGGLRYIWSTPVLRYTLACIATVNLFNYVFIALYVLYIVRTLHVSAGMLGLMTGVGSVGAIISSTITGKLSQRVGLGYALLLGTIGFPAPLILIPLAQGSHVWILVCLFCAEFLSGVGLMILDISYGVILAAAIPGEFRARINGAWGFVNNGIRPLGALLGGVLSTWLGLHGALWIGTIGACIGFLWLFPSRILGRRDVNDFRAHNTDAGTLDV